MTELVVTVDDLARWTQDARTQGLSPAFYVLGVLTEALDGAAEDAGVRA